MRSERGEFSSAVSELFNGEGIEFPLSDPLVRKAIHQAWKNTCQYCLAQPSEHIDHIVPLSRNGPNILANYFPACVACNLRKSGEPFEEQTALYYLSLAKRKSSTIRSSIEKERARKKGKKIVEKKASNLGRPKHLQPVMAALGISHILRSESVWRTEGEAQQVIDALGPVAMSAIREHKGADLTLIDFPVADISVIEKQALRLMRAELYDIYIGEKFDGEHIRFNDPDNRCWGMMNVIYEFRILGDHLKSIEISRAGSLLLSAPDRKEVVDDGKDDDLTKAITYNKGTFTVELGRRSYVTSNR